MLICYKKEYKPHIKGKLRL